MCTDKRQPYFISLTFFLRLLITLCTYLFNLLDLFVFRVFILTANIYNLSYLLSLLIENNLSNANIFLFIFSVCEG